MHIVILVSSDMNKARGKIEYDLLVSLIYYPTFQVQTRRVMMSSRLFRHGQFGL